MGTGARESQASSRLAEVFDFAGWFMAKIGDGIADAGARGGFIAQLFSIRKFWLGS